MTSAASEKLPTKFIQTPSSHLTCPVCGCLYEDPVINIKCGHTFCRKCVFKLSNCPPDNSHCDTSQIVVNRLVVGQIEDLQIYCRHSLVKNKEGEWEPQPDLCSAVLSFGKRTEHENNCPFALVSCPNSKLCGQVQRRNLQDHLTKCMRKPCPYYKHGCNFCGKETEVINHSASCTFQESHSQRNLTAQRMIQQETAIQHLLSESELFSQRTTKLEQDRDFLKSELDKQWGVIHSLQQRVDTLSSRLDQLNSSHDEHIVSASQVSLTDGDSYNTSVSSTRAHVSLGSSSSPGRNYEKWEMPFQFKCIGTLRGHRDVVWSMTTRKGRLYSGGADGIIKVWSLEELAKGCIDNINAHEGVIHCLATWGNCLISAGADKTVCLWDIHSNVKRSSLEDAHDNIICSMVVYGDLLFASSFSVIKVWDLRSLSLKKTLIGMNHWVRALALSKNKEKLYSGSHNAIQVWSTQNMDHLTSIQHQCGSVYSLAVNQLYIIAGNSGTYNQNIQVYNGETHEFIMTLSGHIGTVTTLVTSPSGRFLFSASHDSTIQMWGLEKLLPIQTLSRHQGAVNTLTLHGDFLLSGSEDHEIKVFRYFQIQ